MAPHRSRSPSKNQPKHMNEFIQAAEKDMAAFVVLEEDLASIVQQAALAEDLSSKDDKREDDDENYEFSRLSRKLNRTGTKVGYIHQEGRVIGNT